MLRTRDTNRILNTFLPRHRGRRESIDDSPFTSSNLVYWMRNGMSGSGTSWPDSSGNGNTNTLTSGVTWTYDSPGPVVTLNGTSQGITAAHSTSLNITTSGLTISIYLKFNALPPASKYPNLIGKHTDFTGYSLFYNGDTQRVVLQIGDGAAWRLTADATGVSTGEWIHYCGVITTTSFDQYLYRNGAVVAQTVPAGFSPTANTATLSYAQHYSLPGTYGYLSCTIASAAIWNRGFSAGEVRNLYNLMRY